MVQEHLTHPPDGAQEVIGYVAATATVFLHLRLVQHKHRRGGGG
jgi:hypothetical protein